QERPVGYRHRAGVVDCRHLIEYEIGVRQASCMNAVQNDRLPIEQRDDGVAVGVFGQMSLNIGEGCKAGVTDQINLIMGYVETVDDIVTNGLREYDQVVST